MEIVLKRMFIGLGQDAPGYPTLRFAPRKASDWKSRLED
jgi:hypothetical protein